MSRLSIEDQKNLEEWQGILNDGNVDHFLLAVDRDTDTYDFGLITFGVVYKDAYERELVDYEIEDKSELSAFDRIIGEHDEKAIKEMFDEYLDSGRNLFVGNPGSDFTNAMRCAIRDAQIEWKVGNKFDSSDEDEIIIDTDAPNDQLVDIVEGAGIPSNHLISVYGCYCPGDSFDTCIQFYNEAEARKFSDLLTDFLQLDNVSRNMSEVKVNKREFEHKVCKLH